MSSLAVVTVMMSDMPLEILIHSCHMTPDPPIFSGPIRNQAFSIMNMLPLLRDNDKKDSVPYIGP